MVNNSLDDLQRETTAGYLDICVKCSYQNGAFELTNTVRVVGECSYYLDWTIIDPYIQITSPGNEAYIIDGTSDDPIINMPVPN